MIKEFRKAKKTTGKHSDRIFTESYQKRIEFLSGLRAETHLMLGKFLTDLKKKSKLELDERKSFIQNLKKDTKDMLKYFLEKHKYDCHQDAQERHDFLKLIRTRKRQIGGSL